MTNSAQQRVVGVAGAIGCTGRLPRVRVVTPETMRAMSCDPLNPAESMIRNQDGSGDLLVTGKVGDGTLIHELTHHLLKTSPVATVYPHPGSDVDGHGPVFAAACWSLLGRAQLPLPDGPGDYDLGRRLRPRDRPASQEEERWARRWVARSVFITESAESLAAAAICDYRRWWWWRQIREVLVVPARLILVLFLSWVVVASLASLARL